MKNFRQQHDLSLPPAGAEPRCQTLGRQKGSRWHFFIGFPCSLVCLLFLLFPTSGVASCRARSSSEDSATELQTRRVAQLADSLLSALFAQDHGGHCHHEKSAQAHSSYLGDNPELRKKSPLCRVDRTHRSSFLVQQLPRPSFEAPRQGTLSTAVTSCHTLSGRAIITFIAPKLGPPLR